MYIWLNQDHNFYRVGRCEVVQQKAYYASCLRKIGIVRSLREMRKSDDEAAYEEAGSGLRNCHDCAAAIRKGKGACAAYSLFKEEKFGKSPKYYVDRDDAGPGIISREELGLPKRGQEEREYHHELLDTLGIAANEVKPSPVPREESQKPTEAQVASKPTAAPVRKKKAAGAFSLAGLITEQAEQVNA